MEEEVGRVVDVEGRELLIKKDGRVVRSPVPESMSPAMFRHIVAAADLLYRQKGKVPTQNEIMSTWTGFSKKVVGEAMASPEYQAALRIRGIEYDTKLGLTAEQLYAIQILQDPTDRRSTKARLEEVGISIAKYRAWMRNPLFSTAMSQQAEDNFGDSVQMALNRLVANAESGDQRAIEKILEISGRWNPQQQEVQNARTVVLMVMEVVQEELAEDKEALHRILGKIQGKMASLSVVKSISN